MPYPREEKTLPRIQHVTITVPSEEMMPAVEEFYRLIGGTPLVRPPALEADTPGRWLGFGESQLHLIVGEPVRPPAHFALELGETYDGVLARLKRHGCSVRQARDLWGGRRSFAEDPAGNRVELFDRPPDSVPEDSGDE